ncbi:hypothetical protein SASPL_100995 [Salvia splendens]|uniref:Uncharacterized protein n=1 Tax=Salvia splendens TaxID=180675 RepID=A0A8X9AAT7_SALSN|nr:hypothetical protein SASPL_100995 [Salvia splendens]
MSNRATGRTEPMTGTAAGVIVGGESRSVSTPALDTPALAFEHVLASLARLEARREVTERRAAVAQPPPRPDPDPPYAEWQRGKEDSGRLSAGVHGGSAWDRYEVSAGMTHGRQTTAWDNPAHKMDNRAERHVPESENAWGRREEGPYSHLQHFDHGRLDQPHFDHYLGRQPTAWDNPTHRLENRSRHSDGFDLASPESASSEGTIRNPLSSSFDEDDSGSETESESDASEVRPLAAKPVEETPKSNRKAKSKPAADPGPLERDSSTDPLVTIRNHEALSDQGPLVVFDSISGADALGALAGESRLFVDVKSTEHVNEEEVSQTVISTRCQASRNGPPIEFPSTVERVLDIGSSMTSMDFHPVHEALLLVGKLSGDVEIWDVAAYKKLFRREFVVKSLMEKMDKNHSISVNRVLWSEEDEIVILEGMIEFQNNMANRAGIHAEPLVGSAAGTTRGLEASSSSTDPPYVDFQRGRADPGRQTAIWTSATAVTSMQQLGFGGGPSSLGPQHAALPGASPWDCYGVSAGNNRGRQPTAWVNPDHRHEIHDGRQSTAWDSPWAQHDGGGYSEPVVVELTDMANHGGTYRTEPLATTTAGVVMGAESQSTSSRALDTPSLAF